MESDVTKGPHSFDSALQTANEWLREIDDRLLCGDRQTAYEALRAVLHVLRDRLPLEGVLGLSAQSPMLIRGVLLEGWRPQDGPSAIRDPQAFGDAVADLLPRSFPGTGLEAVDAVFSVLEERLEPGEVRKIKAWLPEPLRPLWPGGPGPRFSPDMPSPSTRRGEPSKARRGPLSWGFLAGVVLMVCGGALLWVLATPVLSGVSGPAGLLADPDQGLRRLALGLSIVGLVTLAVTGLAAVVLRRTGRT